VNSKHSARLANKVLTKYSYLLLGGFVAVLVGVYFYTPLDSDRVYICCMVVFFLPMIAHVVIAVRRRMVENVEMLRRWYLAAGIVLALLATSILANGAFDRAAPSRINCLVIYKTVSSGRHSTTYSLHVPSWRPGRTTERFDVSMQTYRSAKVGVPVSVDMHAGLLGIPWYGHVVAGQ
jgi:uncharacterized membrane protein YiaA